MCVLDGYIKNIVFTSQKEAIPELLMVTFTEHQTKTLLL